MPRKQRVDFAGAWHHLMNRGAAHGPIFGDRTDRLWFLSLVGEASVESGTEVHAYALMGNHYHLLVCSTLGDVSGFAKFVSQQYTHRYNWKYDLDGALFRGRFHSKLVDSDDYLLWLSRYIHLNPKDLGGHIDPATYPWSSYRSYLGEPEAEPWLRRRTVLSMVGGDPGTYRRYVESDQGEVWVEPAERRLLDRLVAAGLPTGAKWALASRRKRHQQRDCALFVGLRILGLSAEALAHHLGPATEGGVRAAVRRVGPLVERDPSVAETVEQIRRDVQK